MSVEFYQYRCPECGHTVVAEYGYYTCNRTSNHGTLRPAVRVKGEKVPTKSNGQPDSTLKRY